MFHCRNTSIWLHKIWYSLNTYSSLSYELSFYFRLLILISVSSCNRLFLTLPVKSCIFTRMFFISLSQTFVHYNIFIYPITFVRDIQYSSAMNDMGDKINSKKIAKAAGCYVIPGFEGAATPCHAINMHFSRSDLIIPSVYLVWRLAGWLGGRLALPVLFYKRYQLCNRLLLNVDRLTALSGLAFFASYLLFDILFLRVRCSYDYIPSSSFASLIMLITLLVSVWSYAASHSFVQVKWKTSMMPLD